MPTDLPLEPNQLDLDRADDWDDEEAAEKPAAGEQVAGSDRHRTGGPRHPDRDRRGSRARRADAHPRADARCGSSSRAATASIPTG